MKAMQLYYTSCENGYEQSPGFQVKAISKNFDDNYIPEFKTLGTYRAPYNFPSQPMESEISSFPIAFRYKKKDNLFLFTHTAYTGKDFTAQRYGNYFLHGILLKELDIWPVDLYYANIFKKEDYEDKIYIEEVTIKVDKEKIKENYLIAVNEINKEILLKMIKSLFLSNKDKRPLLVKVKNDKEALNYLVSLQKLFPLNFAKNISFSSYQFNYNSLCDINFTIGETDLNFDLDDFNYNFYILDTVNHKYSQTNEKINYEYEKIINFIYEADFLEEFYKFSNYFNIDDFSNLDDVFKLFLVLNNHLKISSIEIINLLDMVKIVKESHKNWLIEKFLIFIEKMDITESEYLFKLTDFYSVVYQQNKEPVYKNFLIKNVYTLYLETLKNKYDEKEYLSLYKRIIEKLSLENEFKKYIIKNIKLILNNEDLKFTEINIIQFFEYISLLQEKSKFEVLNFLIEKSVTIPLEILSFFENKNNIVLLMIDDNENFVFEFMQNLYFEDKNSYFEWVKFLYKNKKLNFLKLHFEKNLQYTDNKIAFFNFFINNIESKNDKELFLQLFWQNLSLAERKNQIEEWNKTDKLNKLLESALKEDIIKEINRNISFNDKNNFDNLLEKFESLKFDEEANNFFLKRVILKFKSEDLERIEKELDKLKKKDIEGYKNYLIQFYNNVNILNLEESLNKLFVDNLDNKIIVEIFNRIILEKNCITPLDNKLILFWLEVNNGDFKYKNLQEGIIKEIIIKKSKKIDKKERKKLEKYLSSMKDSSKNIDEFLNKIDNKPIPIDKFLNKEFFNKVNIFLKKVLKG